MFWVKYKERRRKNEPYNISFINGGIQETFYCSTCHKFSGLADAHYYDKCPNCKELKNGIVVAPATELQYGVYNPETRKVDLIPG